MPTLPNTSPRSLALNTLLAVEKGQYGNIAVDTALRRHPMSDPDRHLYTALVYGVTERKTTLEFLLAKFSSRPAEEPAFRITRSHSSAALAVMALMASN